MVGFIKRANSNAVTGAIGSATLASLALLLLGGATSARAAPIVVDPNPTPCIATAAHYTTIQAAVTAAPSGATIQVCPGTYPEQVTIATPLTLRGVVNTAGNTGAAVITVPGGTLTSPFPFTQVLIQAANVNLVDMGVDGTNTASGCFFGISLTGILFDTGSSGTLQHVTLRNHNISDGSGGYCFSGIPVYATSAASVTVADSSVRNYDGVGIDLTTTSDVVVKTSAVAPITPGPNCVQASAPTVQVSGNSLANCRLGASVATTTQGTVSGNTIVGIGAVSSGAGVQCFPNCTGLTVSGNQISNTFNGMTIKTSGGVGGVVFQSNDISGTANGVYLFLQPGNTVSNNTITDASVGVYGATGNTLSGNIYRTVTNLTQ